MDMTIPIPITIAGMMGTMVIAFVIVTDLIDGDGITRDTGVTEMPMT